MPKLILFVVCLVVFAAFSVMNANNKCDINFIFKKFEEVNIVIALVISFTLGVLFTLPIAFTGRARAAKRAEEKSARKMTRAEKKSENRTQSWNGPAESDAESDSLIKEKLGMESPRGNTPPQ
jgi:hypothetical protein